MCIAIVKPVGGVITDDALRNSAASNRDGGGYAFINGKGKVIVRKGYFNVDKMIEDYREDEKKYGDKSPALIHFRISTGGRIGESNCHPFAFKHGALIHNGYFFSGTSEKSDTHLLVEAIGDRLTRKAAEENKEALGKHFGGGNKVALLFRDRSFVIINETAGSWVDGVWYSNRSFQAGVYSRRPGPVSVSPSVGAAVHTYARSGAEVAAASCGIGYDETAFDDDVPWPTCGSTYGDIMGNGPGPHYRSRG